MPPGSAFGLLGQSPNQGRSPELLSGASGGAEPRLTSGGRAPAGHEIGIRLALGAQLSDVLKLVLSHGLKLTIVGAALGLFGAFVATRAIASVLYGVSATDPLTFVLVSGLLVGVALVACYVPSRRATKVDPLVALRNE